MNKLEQIKNFQISQETARQKKQQNQEKDENIRCQELKKIASDLGVYQEIKEIKQELFPNLAQIVEDYRLISMDDNIFRRESNPMYYFDLDWIEKNKGDLIYEGYEYLNKRRELLIFIETSFKVASFSTYSYDTTDGSYSLEDEFVKLGIRLEYNKELNKINFETFWNDRISVTDEGGYEPYSDNTFNLDNIKEGKDKIKESFLRTYSSAEKKGILPVEKIISKARSRIIHLICENELDIREELQLTEEEKSFILKKQNTRIK